MTESATTRPEVSAREGATQDYGLRTEILGPVETLAQSVSAVAPSTSASLTIPLVFALSGNATWFVYLVATAAILLVGFCISRFARLSASPGSLYTYTASTLPPVFGVVAACGLLLAYLATGASVAGGAVYYADILMRLFIHWSPPAIPILIVVCGVAGWIAYRDIKLSAELMLWIEVISVSLILIVLLALVYRGGLQFDRDQFTFRGSSAASLGPALVLAIFSFAGFESATALGIEARDPLRTIPRVILQCAVMIGAFFMLCAYAEVFGFRGQSAGLSETSSPLHILAARAGIAPLGIAIDVGAFISMFACVLACTTAAARVLLRMAKARLLPSFLETTSPRHRTPVASIALSVAMMFAATATMALRRVSGSEMYDLCGSLSVFGFLTAYALVAIALPFAYRARGRNAHVVAPASVLTIAVVVLIAVFDLRSSADRAHARIPYIYLAYVAVALGLYLLRRNRTIPVSD